jgi:hypothetical protein
MKDRRERRVASRSSARSGKPTLAAASPASDRRPGRKRHGPRVHQSVRLERRRFGDAGQELVEGMAWSDGIGSRSPSHCVIRFGPTGRPLVVARWVATSAWRNPATWRRARSSPGRNCGSGDAAAKIAAKPRPRDQPALHALQLLPAPPEPLPSSTSSTTTTTTRPRSDALDCISGYVPAPDGSFRCVPSTTSKSN